MISIEDAKKLLSEIDIYYNPDRQEAIKRWQNARLVEKPTAAIDMARMLKDSIMDDKLVSSGQGSRQLLTDGLQGKAFQMADWYEKHITLIEKELEKSRTGVTD